MPESVDLTTIDDPEDPAITQEADKVIAAMRALRDAEDGPGLDVCAVLFDAIAERLDKLCEETDRMLEEEADASLLADDVDDTDDDLLIADDR